MKIGAAVPAMLACAVIGAGVSAVVMSFRQTKARDVIALLERSFPDDPDGEGGYSQSAWNVAYYHPYDRVSHNILFMVAMFGAGEERGIATVAIAEREKSGTVHPRLNLARIYAERPVEARRCVRAKLGLTDVEFEALVSKQ